MLNVHQQVLNVYIRLVVLIGILEMSNDCVVECLPETMLIYELPAISHLTC